MAERDVLPCNFRFSAYIAFCMFAVLNEPQLKEHKFWGCSAEAAVETGCSVEATCVAMCPYKPASRGHDRNFLPGCRCVLAETRRHCMHVWDFHSHAGLEKNLQRENLGPKTSDACEQTQPLECKCALQPNQSASCVVVAAVVCPQESSRNDPQFLMQHLVATQRHCDHGVLTAAYISCKRRRPNLICLLGKSGNGWHQKCQGVVAFHSLLWLQMLIVLQHTVCVNHA